VAVQNTEAPCGENEKPRSRKQDAHNPNGQFAFFAAESRRNRVNQVRRRQNAEQDKDGSAEGEQGRNGPGGAASFLVFIARNERGVDGNKRSGEHSFAKQILQRIRNAEGRLERVRGVGIPKVMRKYAVANESRDAAQENSGRNEERRALRSEAAGDCCPSAAHEQVLQGDFIVSRNPLQEQQGRKSTTTVEGCAVPEAGFSSAGFSLWVSVFARINPHRLNPALLPPAPRARTAQGFHA
jgi:hypothetical protein